MWIIYYNIIYVGDLLRYIYRGLIINIIAFFMFKCFKILGNVWIYLYILIFF
jgi:hypothetical protein